MGFSLEEERRLRQLAVSSASSVDDEIKEAIRALDSAMDSRDMSIVLQKIVAKKVLLMLGEGKFSGGDLVRLMGIVNDRADGKVAEKIEIEMTTTDEAIAAVKELVRSGVIDATAAERELRLLGITTPVIDASYTVTSAPRADTAPDMAVLSDDGAISDDGVLE